MAHSHETRAPGILKMASFSPPPPPEDPVLLAMDSRYSCAVAVQKPAAVRTNSRPAKPIYLFPIRQLHLIYIQRIYKITGKAF